MTDDYYCHDCWDSRRKPAPPRCNAKEQHNQEEAVKVEIIVHRLNGDTIHIESDDFEYIEFETKREKRPFLHDDLYRAVPLGKTDIILTVKRAGKYLMRHNKFQPVLPDPNVVDEGE